MPGSDVLTLIPRLLALINLGVGWLATYALHSTLLIFAAWVVTSARAPWRMAISTRDVVWKCVLVGGLVTASLQTAFDAAPLGGTWKLPASATPSAAHVRLVVTSGDVTEAKNLTARYQTRLPSPQVATAELTLPPLGLPGRNDRPVFAFVGGLSVVSLYVAAVALLWLAGAVFMLSRYDRARTRLDRMLADRVPADDGIAGGVLREAMRRAGVRKRIRLTASDYLESPAVLASDEICVPRRFLRDVNILEQETIFAHELAHVVRRDSIWLRLANLLVHVFYFQPLNRLARARMIEVAEFSADELAVRTTGAPLHLARALAAVASWLSPATRLTAIPAMASARGSVLVRRVTQLTSWPSARPAPRRSAAPALALVTLAAAGALVPRIDLSHPWLSAGARRMVFQERIEKSDGVSAMQVRVVNMEVGPDSTDSTSGTLTHSRDVVVRRISSPASTAAGDRTARRAVTRSTSPATSD